MCISGCSSLASIDIPTSVTSIGISSFHKCSSLTSIEIPSGVTLNNCAFAECNSLTSITINENCTLGTNSFRQSGSTEHQLKEITFNGQPTFSGFAVFWGCVNVSAITYNCSDAPNYTLTGTTYNAWASTTATNCIGYNTRNSSSNMFYVPTSSSLTVDDFDAKLITANMFNTTGGGFTLSKTL